MCHVEVRTSEGALRGKDRGGSVKYNTLRMSSFLIQIFPLGDFTGLDFQSSDSSQRNVQTGLLPLSFRPDTLKT